MATSLAALAPAKVNLTLRILGRRADGYHELESLVVFAGCGDHLTFHAGPDLDLTVAGPTAGQSGAVADNLVLRAAKALADQVPGLTVGRFALTKELPAGAGLGGGSADAAAALRLLAHANALALDDPRLVAVARATGADVPVCLDPRPRVMRGIGDILSAPLALPKLGIIIVHPGIAMPTPPVFKALGLTPGERCAAAEASGPVPEGARGAAGVARRRAQRPRAACRRHRPGDCGRHPRHRRAAGMPARPHVRLRLGLLRPVRHRGGAAAAVRGLAQAHPGWWARASSIGG